MDRTEAMSEKPVKQNGQRSSATPSMLDRLIDDRADIYHYSLNQLIESIRRDLEFLLNTPQIRSRFGPEFRELHSSILDFGIPDVVSITGKDAKLWERLLDDVENSISHFEPRLKNVVTSLKQNQRKHHAKIEFEIRGQLVFEPSPELIFESIIELAEGRTLIEFPSLLATTEFE